MLYPSLSFRNSGSSDSDALAYIAAVEAADGQSLESGVKSAITDFIVGCKSDGIWNAIKASCILAGARTLNGALVPLAGTAPTNYNFVSGDYNRKTGLVGNGTTKYLDPHRNDNDDPQNDKHLSTYISVAGSGTRTWVSGINYSWLARDTNNFYARLNQLSSATNAVSSSSVGFFGASRTSASSIVARFNGQNSTSSIASVAPAAEALDVFRKGNGSQYVNDRLAFYSIGESLDLAKLDTRITDLITAFGVAIP